MMKILPITLQTAVVLLLASCNAKDLSGDIVLSDGWKIQSSSVATDDGSLISSPEYVCEGWYKASVPSTVMGTLSENGLYDNLLEQCNYKEADASIFDVPWWYRTEFTISDIGDRTHVCLNFDGVGYASDVWLNGQCLMASDEMYGPFRRHELDITGLVKGKNILAVKVRKAVAGEFNIGFVDWNPRPLDGSMGIFREVRVSMDGGVSISDPFVRSKFNEDYSEAFLELSLDMENHRQSPVNCTLHCSFDGKNFKVPVSLQGLEKKHIKLTADEIKALHVRHPKLWWCHNLGKPELYRMELSVKEGNMISDKKAFRFGIREIKAYMTEEGHRGFILNGQKVLVLSAGWSDDIFLRNTPERNRIELEYVKDMNLNSVRFENFWGTSQNVYDLCDELGIMMLAGWSCFWEWKGYLGTECDEFGGIKSEHDMNLITESLRDQVLWLRNHPSIIAWYLGSDLLPRPELEKRYLAVLADIDGRPSVSSAKALTSSITGKSGMKMAGPYDYVAPLYWYLDEAPGGAFGFNTETGIGAQLPVKESIEKTVGTENMWPVNKIWDYHCTTSGTAMNNLGILKESVMARYGKPAGLDDFLKKSDLLNYEGTRAMFEAFRVNVPRATGIVQWMLNSAWPSFYWQLYDYYLVPTAAYYSVKKGNAPVQLIYDYRDCSAKLVNGTLEKQTCDITLQQYNPEGKLLRNESVRLDAGPMSVTEVFRNIRQTESITFLSMNGKDNVYCLTSSRDEFDWDETDWVYTPMSRHADFSYLNRMQDADIEADAATDGSEVKLTLTNNSGVIAFFIRMTLKTPEGEIPVPVRWEDNYLTLRPYQTASASCIIPPGTDVDSLTLEIQGWNTDPISMKL